MKTTLVHTKGNDVFTDSLIIAEKLEVKHADLLRTIENIILRKKQVAGQRSVFDQKFIKSTFTNKMNRTYECYELNEPAFSKLVMNLSGYDKAEAIQDMFITDFFRMKEVIQNQSNNSWLKARESGKELRLEETDVIKQLTEYAEKERGKPVSYPLYSTYTQMTNKHLQFIVDCKEGIPIRDLASARDLGFIGVVDDRCKNAIQDGMERKLPYKEIYRYAKEEVNKLVDMLDFKPKLTTN